MLGPRLHRTRVQSSGGDVECGPLACIRLNTGNSTYFERMKRFFRFRLEFHLFTVAQNTPLQLKSNVKCVQSVKSYFSTSLVSLLRLKQFEGIVFAPSKMSFWMRCWETGGSIIPSSLTSIPHDIIILSWILYVCKKHFETNEINSFHWTFENQKLQKRTRTYTKFKVVGCWVWTCEGVRCEHILPNGRTQMQGDA